MAFNWVSGYKLISRLPGESLYIFFIFWSYCPLKIWTIKTCYKAVSKIIIAMSFKLCQLIEDDE